jgi:NADH-quinone oxidoreductase subunit F
MWVYKILERAINEAKAAGWLGKYKVSSGYDLDFICTLWWWCIYGEETALIESLEGKEILESTPFLQFQDFGQIQRLSIT